MLPGLPDRLAQQGRLEPPVLRAQQEPPVRRGRKGRKVKLETQVLKVHRERLDLLELPRPLRLGPLQLELPAAVPK